jgi:carboxypeptidase C (cathepsin A)
MAVSGYANSRCRFFWTNFLAGRNVKNMKSDRLHGTRDRLYDAASNIG